MKKLVFLFALLVLIGLGCSEESLVGDRSGDGPEGIALDTRGGNGNKVDVCHNGHIINVSINSLPAHQAHGDAVDMDGDGYFDIDNVCGPTDCDDTDAERTDNCCPGDFGFCEYLEDWNIDPTCDEYCDRLYTYSYDGGNNYYSQEYGYLHTYEYYEDCDGDGQQIQAYVVALTTYRYYYGDEYTSTVVYYYLYDYSTNTEILNESYEVTEAEYLEVRAYLAEVAAELGMTDECEDESYENMVENDSNGLDGKNGGVENSTKPGFDKFDIKKLLPSKMDKKEIRKELDLQK